VAALAMMLGRSAIVVADRPGLVLHRLAAALFTEALWLLADGASVQQIDARARELGLAEGPLRLLDEAGLDWFAGLLRRLEPATEERLRPPPIMQQLIDAGHSGQRTGRGLHRYTRAGTPQGTNPELYALLYGKDTRPPAEIAVGEIRRRLLLALSNEAAHLVGEGAASSVADIDLAAVRGLGFPPQLGGPLWAIDRAGAAAVCARLRALQGRDRPRYAPAPRLARMAADGTCFHPAEFLPRAGSGHAEHGMLE
jgi:3-hydroxyacyl-CoA dehydrogenase / enoyl-CoA hydratase / 3-hydroxybutyryl-CoA epimerase